MAVVVVQPFLNLGHNAEAFPAEVVLIENPFVAAFVSPCLVGADNDSTFEGVLAFGPKEDQTYEKPRADPLEALIVPFSVERVVVGLRYRAVGNDLPEEGVVFGDELKKHCFGRNSSPSFPD
jgi:hypothetical protein